MPETRMTSHPDVQGRCPACGSPSLFLGSGGHVACSLSDCPDPSAAANMLDEGAPMLHRVAVLASDLFMAGKPGPERETARKFLAALQRSEPRLLDCGWCYEEQGEECHPHPECPIGAGGQPAVEDVVRLEGALHVLRFALDRFIQAKDTPAPEFLRDLLDKVTEDSGEPCDRDRQYARAEQAEAGMQRVTALYERWVKAGPPPLGVSLARWQDKRLVELHHAIHPPVREQRERPAHPDGTPYRYHEIVAEGWRHCDGCGAWTTATPTRPHRCPETHTRGPVVGTARISLDVQASQPDGQEAGE